LQSAKDDLNIVRKRACLPDANANTKDELLLAIELERQKEFFAEWGHRWLDLKRTDRANTILAPIKAPNWQPTDILYPLPFQEIQRNHALIQNEGY
jgi:starch-binding outer membrane protein, SusD/RagB family